MRRPVWEVRFVQQRKSRRMIPQSDFWPRMVRRELCCATAPWLNWQPSASGCALRSPRPDKHPRLLRRAFADAARDRFLGVELAPPPIQLLRAHLRDVVVVALPGSVGA